MDSPAEKIVVTGYGAISALGTSAAEIWQKLIAGQSGITEVEAWDTAPYRTHLAGEVKAFPPAALAAPRSLRRCDRCHLLLLHAAHEAVTSAGLAPEIVDPHRVGVSLGTSLASMITASRYNKTLLNQHRYARSLVYLYPFQMCVEHITAAFGFLGPRTIVSTACTASTIALARAFDLIRFGHADIVLAGGVDPLAEFSFAGFNSMNNVSAAPCAPFSSPTGLNTGEGAALLVLERASHALARGAAVHAELCGWGLTADAYHPTSPDPAGASQIRLLAEALQRSGVSPENIDYLNAHGTGTETNDAVESRVIEAFFGKELAHIPVSSIKGAIGHCLGAAGALEALVTVLAIKHGMLPPSVNFTQPRRGCSLDYVPNTSRPKPVKYAVSQNFAFGGNNAALVFAAPNMPLTACPTTVSRVVITGLGPITPIGIATDQFLAGLRECRPGLGVLPETDADYRAAVKGSRPRVTTAAALDGFQPARYTKADLRRVDRFGQIALAAAEIACRDAGLTVSRQLSERIGCVLGTANGPIESIRKFHRDIALGTPARANPAVFPNTVFNAASGLIAAQLKLRGPNITLTGGEASGLNAVGCAYDLVCSGAADAVICGGIDQLEPYIVDGYWATRKLSPAAKGGSSHREHIAPFSPERNGTVLGEGAGFLVLESLDSAERRGARILGEIVAYHTNADAPRCDYRDPQGSGVAYCVTEALARAAVSAAAIDLIAAAGFSDPLYDAVEAAAIKQVFADRLPPVCAISSLVGLSAATSCIALSATLLGFQHDFLPAGFDPDAASNHCGLNLLLNSVAAAKPKTALITAMAYGGTNTALVVRRFFTATGDAS